MQMLQLVSLAILVVASNVVDGLNNNNNNNKETMVVAENGVSNRYTVTTYTTEGRNVITSEPKMFELHRAKSLLTSSPAASPSSSSAASSVPYYRRPLNYAATSSSSSNNVRDVYKKAASDYYEHEMPAPYGHGGGGGGDDDGGYGEAMNSGHGGYSGQEEHGYHRGQEISITPDHKPITLHYRTHSQPIVVHQTRIPGPKPEVQHTTSHEEPHRVVHEVVRPIIQEVVEIIQPYRKITQEIRPVLEEVKTVVAKDAGRGYSHGGGDGGGYAPMTKSYGEQEIPMKHYSKMAMYGESSAEDRSRDHETKFALKPKRSKAYINHQGVPVYESKYLGPAALQSS